MILRRIRGREAVRMISSWMSRLCLCVIAAAAMGGCARYEYDIVQPQDLAQRVGRAPVTFPIEDLEYRLQTSSNRLVMLIYNRGDEPIKLLGDESYVVDPRGESHPLTERLIAPDSFIRLILPPQRARVRTRGPTFGVGVGLGYSRYHRRRGFHGGGYYPYEPGPYYSTVYDPNDPTFWEWNGEKRVRLMLMFERGDERFSDEFVFHRRRV